MVSITNILYWISTGLLIPVIALLLLGFVRSLVLLGGFFGMYINRLQYEKKQVAFFEKFHENNIEIDEMKQALKGNKLFVRHLEALMNAKGEEALSEKILADFEVASDKDLSHSKSLAKLGPMIGLMGTLIPLGPALVGLAQGDIASMAQNMQVAFSTTVVGIFAGAIGYVTQLVKQRWYVQDLNHLDFAFQIIKKQNTHA